MRSALRYLISSLLVGALSVGLAWAGAGLVPVKSSKLKDAGADLEQITGGAVTARGEKSAEIVFDDQSAPPQGYVLAGRPRCRSNRGPRITTVCGFRTGSSAPR